MTSGKHDIPTNMIVSRNFFIVIMHWRVEFGTLIDQISYRNNGWDEGQISWYEEVKKKYHLISDMMGEVLTIIIYTS